MAEAESLRDPPFAPDDRVEVDFCRNYIVFALKSSFNALTNPRKSPENPPHIHRTSAAFAPLDAAGTRWICGGFAVDLRGLCESRKVENLLNKAIESQKVDNMALTLEFASKGGSHGKFSDCPSHLSRLLRWGQTPRKGRFTAVSRHLTQLGIYPHPLSLVP